MVKKYFERHFKFSGVFSSPDSEEEIIAPPKKKFKSYYQFFIVFLRSLPLICGIGFVTSFFWDFGADNDFVILGYTVELEALLRTISVSGLIGFGTNWLAIRMLFRPVQKRPIWGQGLIPAQKDRIVHQLAGGIHSHILSEELIRKRIDESGIISKINGILLRGTENLLHDVEFREEIKAFVHTHLEANMARPEVREKLTTAIDGKLESKLKSGLKGLVFQTYKRLRPGEYEGMINSMMDNVPEMVIEIIEELEKESTTLTKFLNEKEKDMEQFYSQLVVSILERIDTHSLLSRQMAHLDEAGIERMIWGATNSQLLYIQYLGTLLGIFGGFLIWQPIPISIFYVTLLGSLLVLDTVIFRIQNRSN